MRGRTDADIREDVLLVLKRDEYKRGGASELRIVRWIIDGKTGQPFIERREKWQTEDGFQKMGKAKGLSAGDFWLILERAEEIGRIMGVPAHKVQEAVNKTSEQIQAPPEHRPMRDEGPQSEIPISESANPSEGGFHKVGAATEADPWK
jgi:hypothetical protein